MIRCLSVLPSRQNEGIGNQLLRKAEAICRGNGCLRIKIDITMQRENIMNWLIRHSYKNLAGGVWMNNNDITHYSTFIKDLTKPDINSNSSNSSKISTDIVSKESNMLESSNLADLIEVGVLFYLFVTFGLIHEALCLIPHFYFFIVNKSFR